MQNQFRKYYIDTYLDLQHKNDEDLIAEENSISPNARLTNKMVEPQKEIANQIPYWPTNGKFFETIDKTSVDKETGNRIYNCPLSIILTMRSVYLSSP